MIEIKHLQLSTHKRGFHIVTNEILSAAGVLPDLGLLHVFCQHTSAGICINENADPDVLHDYDYIFNKLVPENLPNLRHTMEGPDDMPAHVKTTLTGSDITIPIENGKLLLGTWQGIYLCEFRNSGGPRKFVLTIVS